LALEQMGSPLVSTLPLRSSWKVSASRVGGVEPSLVPTRVTDLRKTGALPWAGSSRGFRVAVALTETDPISAVIA
jgi:hypothetical protein